MIVTLISGDGEEEPQRSLHENVITIEVDTFDSDDDVFSFEIHAAATGLLFFSRDEDGTMHEFAKIELGGEDADPDNN